jgi:hypothetical protein
MLRIPTDPDFLMFVKEMRRSGASAESIAAALNWSPWADAEGGRWHSRQVERICSAGLDETAAADEDEKWEGVCGCPFHRRLELLQAIRGWQPFDLAAAEQIARYLADGESHRTVASRLNQEGVAAPTGRGWSPRLVAAMAYLSRADRGAGVPREVVAAA